MLEPEAEAAVEGWVLRCDGKVSAAAEAIELTVSASRRNFCDAGINILRFSLSHHYGLYVKL